MTRCAYDQKSFFQDIFIPEKDFNWDMPYEMPEDIQQEYDPVGFYFFHKEVVYKILEEWQSLNNRRYKVRDLLREMDRIWRYNSMQRIVINEPDYRNGGVSARVNELVRLTRKKLFLDARVDNVVTGDTIKHSEFQVPADNPALPLEKQSPIRKLTTPHIDQEISPMPFRNVGVFNRRLYFSSQH